MEAFIKEKYQIRLPSSRPPTRAIRVDEKIRPTGSSFLLKPKDLPKKKEPKKHQGLTGIRRELTEEEKQTMIEMRKSGMSYEAIAIKMHRSKKTVRKITGAA